jgi:YfiH family protein
MSKKQMLYNVKLFRKYQNIQTFFSRKSDGSMKLTANPALEEKISQNRNQYFSKHNINPKTVVSAGIVHGNNVVVVSNDDKGKVIVGADGLITSSKNIYLSITSADCLPIFLFEPEKKIIGMIHAGWRSLEKGIASNAVEKIIKLGGRPENILVGIGPAICQEHYEIDPDVAEKFAKYSDALDKNREKIYLDIKKIAQLQLLELGLQKKNIEISPECTFELPEKYFSARRDKPEEIEAMGAVISIKSL